MVCLALESPGLCLGPFLSNEWTALSLPWPLQRFDFYVAVFKARLPVLLLLFRRLSTGNGICHRFSLTAAAMNKFGFVRYASSFYRNVRVSEQTRVKEITGSGMLSTHSTGSLTHAMVHPGTLARTSCSGTNQG